MRLSVLASALCLFLAFASLVAVPQVAVGQATARVPDKVEQPASLGLFPIQADATESPADANLIGDLLWAAFQEATAQRPLVDVTRLDSNAAQVKSLVAQGIIAEGAVGSNTPLPDVVAIVRSLSLAGAILPRLERTSSRRAHPSFQVILQILLPQSGRMEELTLPGSLDPATLGTSREFESGVRQLASRLISTSLPALVRILSTDRPHDPDAAAQAHKLAQEKIAAGDYEGAARFLQQAVLLTPDNPDYFLLLGDVCLHLNRPGAASDAYYRAVQASPDSFDARSKYADSLVQLSRFSEAEKQMLVARQLKPDDPSAVVGLASIYLRQKDYEKALRLLEEATHNMPDPSLLTQLGDVYRLLRRPEAAQDAYQRALQAGASPESCYQQLAHLFAEQKDFSKTFQFLVLATKGWPGPKACPSGEVADYLGMARDALVNLLDDSRQRIVRFSQMEESRVSLFTRLSALRQDALNVSTFLAMVEAPQPYVDLISRWEAISTLVAQIMLDHMVNVDTNDASYGLVANELREKANDEISAAQKELEKASG